MDRIATRSAKRTSRGRKRCQIIEPLEARLVLDSTVVFNEIMYHPAGQDESLEWIELHNQMGVNMDISGWRLADGVEYTFPAGTIVPGGGHVVVAASPSALQGATGFAAALGPYSGRLANNTDRIELVTNSNRLMDLLEYDDDGLWPVAPDGWGASLAKLDQDTATGDPASWTNSRQVGGTPGQDNFPTGVKNVRLRDASGTGIGHDGNPLAVGQADPHWTVSTTGAAAIVLEPAAGWAANTAKGRWIGTGPGNAAAGQITFSTTFDLTGIDLASARLSFRAVAADQIVDVRFNGQSLGISSLGFTRLPRNPQEIATGFVAGVNRLEVITSNFGGANGLLAELEGSGTTLPLPPDPFVGLMFDEVAGASDANKFAEVVNRGQQSIDLAGVEVRASSGASLALGARMLAPGERAVVSAGQNGFDYRVGDSLILFADSGTKIIDGATVTNSLKARSQEYDLRWLNPDRATPGGANSFALNNNVIINEIFYHGPTVPQIQGIAPTFAETILVPIDATWRHSADFNFGPADPPVNPGSNWANTPHPVDGNDWLQGQAPLGIASRQPRPRISKAFVNPQLVSNFITTYYFETEFGLTRQQIDELDELVLSHIVDDGAVFYVNGQEALRVNMPEGPVDFNTLARAEVSGQAQRSEPIPIRKDNLVALPAMNRLSVEVHQNSVVSDDIVFAADVTHRVLLDPGIPAAAPVESDEEWIELYNRSATETVDLTGWRLSDGVDYSFSPGTRIGPGQFLVLSNDPASFRAKHSSVNPSIVLGPFAGTLSDRGERLELTDTRGNPADVVRYYDRGRWPSDADGGRSSLELRDPDADNSLPEAWAASDESGKSQWQSYTYRGTGANIGADPQQYAEFLFGLLDDGELLMDDIHVIQNPGTADARELIQNGTFQSDTVGGQPDKWRIIGNQHGMVVADPTDPANKVLHLRATGPTEHMHNNAGTTLKAGNEILRRLDANAQYEYSFRAKWLAGTTQLHTRLYFNRIARKTLLPAPDVLGTPGAVNSTFAGNIGPTYVGLEHAPVVPDENEPVTVSVAAADPDRVAAMRLWYAVDSGQFRSVPMTLGNDGRYAGTIPGQAAASIVQFYVEGTDGAGAASMFPSGGPNSRALYKVQDGMGGSGPGHNLRIIMTPTDTAFLHEPTNVMSNDRMGATIISKDRDVFYDADVRLKGSERGRNQVVRVGFNIRLDPMQPFRGVHDAIQVDRSGSGNEYSQEEIIIKQVLNHAGNIPGSIDDLIYVITPQTRHVGSAMLLMSSLTTDPFLDTTFENGSAGTAFEYELVYYPTTTVGRDPEGLKIPEPDNVTGVALTDLADPDLPDEKEAYRWYWLIKNNRHRDDYGAFIAALKAIGQAAGDAFHRDTRDLLDIDAWLRSFAIQDLGGIGDSYSSGAQHNAMFYVRPSDGKVVYMPWDMDFTFTRGATEGITGNGDLRKLRTDPGNDHAYLGHLHDIISTSFNSQYMDPWIDHYQQFVTRQNFAQFKRYIEQRSARMLSVLPAQVPLAITTAGPLDVGDSTVATIAGTGWVNVRQIRLEGSDQPLDVRWTTVTSWEVTVPVSRTTQTVSLQAFDFQGEPIGTASIGVRSTADNPVAGGLRITEINYNPHDPTAEELAENPLLNNDDFEFIEVQNVGNRSINLLNTHFTDGIGFTFPVVFLGAGEHAVIAKNAAAFQLRYGSDVSVVGQFAEGSLSNAGEQLTLVDSRDNTIVSFAYNDSDVWPQGADGRGATLEAIDPAGTPANQFGKHYVWRGSVEFGGSPGAAGRAPVGVVINEVLTNTDAPSAETDAIELYNTTLQPVDIGGWYLSDSADNMLKYRVPVGTTIPERSYVVFYERHFNPNPQNPGPNDFALSGARGDDVWLVIPDSAGGVASLVDDVHFGAARSGESFGRTPNGAGRLAPMVRSTLGGENSQPRGGPIVLSEIHYNPAEPTAAALAVDPDLGRDDLEYVEIYNPTSAMVDLAEWQIRGAARFDFPAGTQLGPEQTLIVVSFDPTDATNSQQTAAFRTQYGIDASVRLVGGYQGTLGDDGEHLQLLRPDAPSATDRTLVPRLLEDEVVYDDLPPWPTGADGSGRALVRVDPAAFGNAATSWTAELPSPGRTNFITVVPGDANSDGVFNQLDVVKVLQAGKYLTGQQATFAEGDWNGDGVFNQRDIVAALQAGSYRPLAAQGSDEADLVDELFARVAGLR
jgi:hypothetical protein